MEILAIAVAIAVVVGGPLLWTLRSPRSRGPVTKVVLLATAPSIGQALDWRDQLVRAGIGAVIRSQGGDIVSLPHGQLREIGIGGYVVGLPEVWVPAKDVERAGKIVHARR